jgi:hypothetical protein
MPAIPAAKLLREVAVVGPASGPTLAGRRAREQALALIEAERLVEAAYTWRIAELDGEKPPHPAASRPPSPTEGRGLPRGSDPLLQPSPLVGEGGGVSRRVRGERQSEPLELGFLRCGGEVIAAPWLIPATGHLTALAAGACTIGAGLEARVRSLFAEKRASVALALDTLGNELLAAASRRVQDGLLGEIRRRGLTMAGELRAGDPGLELDAQGAVLRLAQADTIGIGMTRLALLSPVKSMSVIYGVGVDLPPARWSRCDRCPSRAKCKLVAQKQEAAL